MRPVKRRRKRRYTAPIQRRFSHRTHPAKMYRAPPGVCRWCATDILTSTGKINANKSFCGRVCETAYKVHTDPKVWRHEVWVRDRGICRECGKKHPSNGNDWQADHIQPLFISCGDWNFWSPENGQVLCKTPCHENKTKSDTLRYGITQKRRRPRR